MSETTRNWWQDNEQTDTTRRTNTGTDEDTGSDYDTGADTDPVDDSMPEDPTNVDDPREPVNDYDMSPDEESSDALNESFLEENSEDEPPENLDDTDEPGPDGEPPPDESDESSPDEEDTPEEESGSDYNTGSDELADMTTPDSEEDGEDPFTNEDSDPHSTEENGDAESDSMDSGEPSETDGSEPTQEDGLSTQDPLPSGLSPHPNEPSNDPQNTYDTMHPDGDNEEEMQQLEDGDVDDRLDEGSMESDDALALSEEGGSLDDSLSESGGDIGAFNEDVSDDDGFFDFSDGAMAEAGDVAMPSLVTQGMGAAQDVAKGRLTQGSFSANTKEAIVMGKEALENATKDSIKAFVISHLHYIIAGILAFLILMGTVFGGVVQTIININDEAATQEEGAAMNLDFSNHRLTPEVLRFKDEAAEAVNNQGLESDWTYIVLGLIQQETGGLIEQYPDVMQSSESQGLPMNTFTDPSVSIHYGVMALKDAINAAESNGIRDLRAILQGYNMGHAFLGWMSSNGHSHWTSDIAEEYSKTVVLPSLMGRPAQESDRDPNYSPWAQSIGKPYYWRNGGDFHYPNAIMHHLGIDYSGDGPILLEDVSNAVMTEGSLDGYIYPIPQGQYHITSEYGQRWGRLHAGIDMQYNGSMFHQNGPIYAAADGKVTSVSTHATAGNYINITHGPPGENDAGLDPDVPVVTRYLHLNSPGTVKVGQQVKAGDKIGYEGNTGGSFGDHLHFEIRQNGEAINPRRVYEFPPSVF